MSEGLAMGNPLSPILSDIYLHYFETKLFETITFPFYVRYVDDCFVLLDQNHNNNEFLLSTLNSIDPCIQFTIEMETDSSLSFLDVFITKSNDEFMTSVFRKPFAVTLPPHKCSSHPPNQKLASFKAFVFRALNICSSSNSLSAELSYLKAVAFDRGYSPSIIDSIYNKFIKPSHSEKVSASSASYTIVLPYYPKVSHQVAKILKKFGFDTAFSPVNKIKFTNLKDPIDCHSNWGIYSISCKCGLGYVGQTKRALKHRLKEHENYVKHKELARSSIAQHCWTSGHCFDFSSAKIICKCSSVYDLDFWEAYHIWKNSHSLVNDFSSTPFFHDIWKQFL
ncbi:uncharacterized protein LOC129219457 [Uloborus diversus]|uniref:uncharacterized protein LOC129219457 n=1 Tax=Uloborus diversus TaxID=327109 RepID=UPI0024099279|nr:uncharacterized protein LOC129219457 [Uloborus diversus]